MCWCIALFFLAVGIRMLPCRLSGLLQRKTHIITRLLCFDIKNNRVDAPENYSQAAVDAILENAVVQYEAGNVSTEAPHIILIMNESFADLGVLGNIVLTEDNLSFFHSLQENTIRGYVNASVLGGGTANSEFEVFTGGSI